jgi:hypothetical protein
MSRIPLAVLFATVSFAQTAVPPPASPQPPAEVDLALRARITGFYDLLVGHQYRKAEEFVAPDFRDRYYEQDKPRYLSYELTSIAYSPDFTSADVVVSVRMPSISPMVPLTAAYPMASLWRLLDGDWYWSIRKLTVLDLLRGISGGNSAPPGTDAAPALPPVPDGANLSPSLPAGMVVPRSLPAGVDLSAILGSPEAAAMTGAGGVPTFSMDRSEVAVKPSTTEVVTIANTGSAPMTLFVLGTLPGIEAAFDNPRIEPHGKAKLSIHATTAAAGGALVIGVTETKAMISLPVTVK